MSIKSLTLGCALALSSIDNSAAEPFFNLDFKSSSLNLGEGKRKSPEQLRAQKLFNVHAKTCWRIKMTLKQPHKLFAVGRDHEGRGLVIRDNNTLYIDENLDGKPDVMAVSQEQKNAKGELLSVVKITSQITTDNINRFKANLIYAEALNEIGIPCLGN